jgi:hypothetical protein
MPKCAVCDKKVAKVDGISGACYEDHGGETCIELFRRCLDVWRPTLGDSEHARRLALRLARLTLLTRGKDP